MAKDPRYDQWRVEMIYAKENGKPFPAERSNERPTDIANMLGYWRQIGARTKADTPVAIWPEGDAILVKFGGMDTVASQDSVDRFMSIGIHKCVAVTRPDWAAAIEAGKWADGKRIRLATPEEITKELADILPPGHNSQGEAAELFFEQVREKLEAAMAEIRELGKIDTMEKANEVAEILAPARAVWKLGENQRVVEKAPHDTAAAAVQTKWHANLLKPAADLFKWANDEAVAMGRRETARLQKIEADRIAAEAKAAETERAKQAAAMGIENETRTDEEIEADAAAQAAQAAPPVRVGTAHGKALSAPKQRKGVITDEVKFYAAVKNDPNVKIAMQKKADALARANHTVEGMKIE